MICARRRTEKRPIPFLLPLLAGLMFAGSPAAEEHFLTSTFGNGESCEHRGALTIRGDRIRFDLTAIPPSAAVHRAILRVPGKGHRTGEAVDILPAGAPGSPPLKPRGPLFDSFDATAAVRRWIGDPRSNRGWILARSGGVDFRSAMLEVSHSGKTTGPLPAVTGLQAIHQSGQTFLTWREIQDVVGEDHPTFESFERAVMKARERRHLTYRVYRHGRPITVETLGQAEMIREIPEALSCWNLKALRNTEHPNQGTPTMKSPLRPGYNLARGDIVRRYRITEGGDPLPRGTALAVITVTAPGERYYAVTASIDGREAVAELVGGASLRDPVSERRADFPAIIYQRTRIPEERQKSAPAIDVYNSWIEPPYHNVPAVSETFIVRWRDLPEGNARNRLPLFVNFGTYGSTATELSSPGWHGARRHVQGAFTLGLAEGGLWQGFHQCIGTLRGYEQGVVHNYPQRRVLAATAWAISRKDFFIDPERVSTWGQLGAWALRHGDVFAAVLSNGYGNLDIGKIPQQHGWKWGPYPGGSRNWLGVDQWEYMNLARWIRENPAVELPYWICSPAYGAYPSHTIGDFGFMPWPEMIHAMVSTRRAFAANWSTNGPGPTRPLHDLVPRIRLHQSLPAFTSCSLDHSPGDGDHADAQKGGGINLYPRWDPETIVDERDRWEMTVHLSRECPGEEATLDLTPRRCQKFRAVPGELFRWTRTSPGESRPLQRGEARADRWGLVTLKGLKISRKKQRIILVRAAAPSGSTGAMPPGAETGHGRSPELKVIAPKTAEDLQELFRYTGDSLHLVSAHRGGPGKGFPENCIATFEHTLQVTHALMEVDPRYTKDGAIVLHHDATLERTTSGRGAVADSTLEDLRTLRLKDQEGNLTGYSIPTLDEALEWARGKTILVLDQKDVPLEARIRKIEEHNAGAYAMLIVYSLEDVKLCHSRNGNILMEVMISSRGQFEAFDKTGVPWRNIVAFVGHSPPGDPELLKMIHARGASCMAGTSRNIDRRLIRGDVKRIEELERDYRALLAKGVDLIETDLPREVGPLLFTGVPNEK